MNRIQFWTLTTLSGIIVVLIVAQIFLTRYSNTAQYKLAIAQQVINQGQGCQGMMRQLAVRVFNDSQKNGGDQALKDLMGRQQISFTPSNTANNEGGGTGSPAVQATPVAPATSPTSTAPRQ